MKTKIFVVVVLLLSAAMLTTGAFAYFTTQTRNVAGNIQSGTLDLKIYGVAPSQDCPAFGSGLYGTSGTLWNYQNLAPGDEVDGKLCMENTGTLDIAQILFHWQGLPPALAEHLLITSLYNSQTGEELPNYVAYYDSNHDGKMSLMELFNGNGGGVQEYWVGGLPIFLPTSAPVQWVEYTFVFDPASGNDLQGLDFDYTLQITGYQKAQY
jgi:hypothetical protein